MSVDTIIDLDNNSHYLLLDETILDNKKYFYAVGLEDDLSSPTTEYVFIEEINKDGEIYAKKVVNQAMGQLLLSIFTNNYVSYAENMEETNT